MLSILVLSRVGLSKRNECRKLSEINASHINKQARTLARELVNVALTNAVYSSSKVVSAWASLVMAATTEICILCVMMKA